MTPLQHLKSLSESSSNKKFTIFYNNCLQDYVTNRFIFQEGRGGDHGGPVPCPPNIRGRDNIQLGGGRSQDIRFDQANTYLTNKYSI